MGQMVNNLPAMQETWVQTLGWEFPLRRECNLLQYSCLENPMDRGAWQGMIHRVTKRRTKLKQLSRLEKMENGASSAWMQAGSNRGRREDLAMWTDPEWVSHLSVSLCLSVYRLTHTHTHTQHTHIKMNKHIIYNQDFSYPWHFPSMNVLQ